MGVDYTANYGIGFKVESIEQREGKDDYSMGEIIDEKLSDIKECYYFDTGSEDLGGLQNEFYITLHSLYPIETLEKRGRLLKQELYNVGIKTSEKLDIVGGLKIW